MRTVLVTGGAGYLGAGLIRGAPAGVRLHATQRRTPVRGAVAHPVDLADPAAVRAVWAEVRPELVIHTAYTMDAGERDILAATRAVVDASLEQGAALIHLSSDLVLDGQGSPYDEAAPAAPVNEYGRYKALAEQYVGRRMPAAAVVRTSLITGFDPLDPRSAWVEAGLRGEAAVTLFADEIRCPIALEDLVAQLWELAALPAGEGAGVWNLVGPEALSRYALGLLVARRLGLPPERLTPGLSRDAAAPRPRDLRLSTGRADRMLRARARPLSVVAAEPLLAKREAPA